jgi:hypothetical protein
MIFFFTFHSDMKPCDMKRQVTTQINKMIRGMIKSVTQTFLFWEETQQVDG